MKTLRVYADTSVFGGIFDDEFSVASKKFFQEIGNGNFSLVTSAVVQKEIDSAPDQVKNFFEKMVQMAEIADISEKAISLRNSYLKANILTLKSSDDALHVALATVSKCDLIVSWNFKHIVHFDKISLYNNIRFMTSK